MEGRRLGGGARRICIGDSGEPAFGVCCISGWGDLRVLQCMYILVCHQHIYRVAMRNLEWHESNTDRVASSDGVGVLYDCELGRPCRLTTQEIHKINRSTAKATSSST